MINKIKQSLKKYKLVKLLYRIFFDFHPKHFFPDTYASDKYWNAVMPYLIRKEMRTRIDLLNDLNQKSSKKDILRINNKEGFSVLNNQSDLIDSAVDVALKSLDASGIYDVDYNQLKSQQKKSFLCVQKINLNLDSNKAIKNLITSDKFLLPAANYFGHVPILTQANLLYSPNKEVEEGRSQFFHLDGGDGIVMKIFIALEDINHNNGPLVFVPKSLSRHIYQAMYNDKIVKKRNFKVTDEVFYKFCNKSDIVVGALKKSHALFIDTANSYHYGSRPSPKPRKVLMFEYSMAFSRQSSFFKRNYLDDTLLSSEKINKLVLDSYLREVI